METRRIYSMKEYKEFADRIALAGLDVVRVSTIADTGSFPVIAFSLTDQNADDRQKQNVLFTAMHSGIEYSGANTLISLLEKLVDGSDSSRMFLKAYNITIVPVVNPYSYEKGGLENQYRTENSNDPYTDPWTLSGVVDPDKNTEAAAIMEVIDEIKPELFIDCHGVFYRNQHMRENTGVSVHGMCRPHNELFPRRMNEASVELGYHPEYYDERQKSPTVLPSVGGRKYQTCFYKLNACVYAYHNYHTLAMTMEVGFEGSGVARLVRALELGLERWPGETVPGYPVNRVLGEGFEGIHPYSDDRKAMREQRTLLWNASDDISYGILYPQIPGEETFFILGPGEEEPAGLHIPEGRCLHHNASDNPKLPECPFSIVMKIPFAKNHIKSVEINGAPAPPERWYAIREKGFSLVRLDFPEGIRESVCMTVRYDYALK